MQRIQKRHLNDAGGKHTFNASRAGYWHCDLPTASSVKRNDDNLDTTGNCV